MRARIFLLASLLTLLYASLSYVTAEFRKRPPHMSYVPQPPECVPEFAEVVPVLEFASRDGRGLYLDLYRPKEYTGILPTIISIDSWDWISWRRTNCQTARLCKYGYAVASIEIRAAQKDCLFPAQIYDCKEAVRWLRANAKQYDLDPKRIGVMGTDCGGGHLAALLGTTGDVKKLDGFSSFPKVSAEISAACVINPITDFTLFTDKEKLKEPFSCESRIINILGSFPSDDLGGAKYASPFTYISKSTCPFLIFSFAEPGKYPDSQVAGFQNKLLLTGIPSECRKGKGEPCYSSIARFFDNHMSNEYSKITYDNMPNGCRKIENQVYASMENGDLSLDLYVPEISEKRIPIIIVLDDDSWYIRGKDNEPPDRDFGLFFLKYGFAVAKVRYTGLKVAPFPRQIFDCKAAVRWLDKMRMENQKFRGQPGAFGRGFGGYLALLLGRSPRFEPLDGGPERPHAVYSDYVSTVCTLDAITDLQALHKYYVESGLFEETDTPVSKILWGTTNNQREVLDISNIMNPKMRHWPDILTLHRDNYKMIPLSQSADFFNGHKTYGKVSCFETIIGAPENGFLTESLQERIAEHFIECMR